MFGRFSGSQIIENKQRAVHCLMWAHGKTIKNSAWHEWNVMTNWKFESNIDPLRYFDGAKEKEESDRRRALGRW